MKSSDRKQSPAIIAKAALETAHRLANGQPGQLWYPVRAERIEDNPRFSHAGQQVGFTAVAPYTDSQHRKKTGSLPYKRQ
ncbi:hypothetical protein [Desulfopila sp. IMCC35008]|uniref:hypothetical protein n=1 Tax=Desulfopila sp. IMCC35008 TaxID=2653858 RepID=UPI0013D5D621|nr:hypothetical protein [Desulfopila sp. IMCC35008]